MRSELAKSVMERQEDEGKKPVHNNAIHVRSSSTCRAAGCFAVEPQPNGRTPKAVSRSASAEREDPKAPTCTLARKIH